MYFSIFVVIIPVYADNQDYGEIVTVGYHLPPPLINLNPPEIYPEPKITDVEGENFKLYSHEFFIIKIPENFVPDNSSESCPQHDQLCNYGKWFWSPPPEGATEYDLGKKRQSMYIAFNPYFRYTNTVDLTNDATFNVPYILDEMQRKGYLKDLFSSIKNKIDYACNYFDNDDFGCKNLVINEVRFLNINGMPSFQIESEFDWKPPSPYSTEHYKYNKVTDKKFRTFEHVSEIITTIFTRGYTVVIYASTTHSDYVESPASWKDIVHAVNSFDTINDVHKITDSIVLERLEETRNKFDTILENNMYRIKKLNQTKIQITNLVDELDSRPICGKGTIEKNGQCISDTTLQTKPIPEWVRGVFVFWSENDISDVELTSAVAFLIDSEIIKVPLIQELQNEITQLKAENSELRTKLELPQPTPEPISQQELQIFVQTDDSNKNEIGIDSDSPLVPNISIANPRVVDAFGNELDSVSVGQQIQIGIDITNHNNFEQPFNYHITIGGTGYEESISGSLSAGQSFSPALTWIPTEAGIFSAELSVFDNLQNKNKLTDSITLQIRVS